MSDKIRVLIVDDSPLIREALKVVLTSDPDIEVVGMACDGNEGVKKALALKPDVITMDIKMPVMTGLEAIESIMEDNPIPIVVVSSMDVKVIVKALTIGAMDFVAIEQEIEQISQDLIQKVKIASRVKPLRRMKIRPITIAKPPITFKKEAVTKIIAIGISTGGPQALHVLFSSLPHSIKSGIIVVQHMSKGFMNGLVEWLRLNSALDIQVAKAGDVLKSGMVLFAPDDYNIMIDEDARIILKEDVSKRMLHVPSIDEMMKSTAASFGENAVGLIMTGMGKDGVEGMKAIKRAGGITLAQDEATSVIYGMNKVAVDSGCIDEVLPLEKIADQIMRLS